MARVYHIDIHQFSNQFIVNDVNVFLCILILYTFDFDVVTVVCHLLINGYVMLCYVKSFCYSTLASPQTD